MSTFLRKYRNGFIVLCLLSCCVAGCSPSTSAPSASSKSSPLPTVWAKDFAPGQLALHYEKHRDEFGAITMEEYLDNARALLNAAPGKDIQEKARENGDILRFRLSTGEFAVMTAEGRIRTYFKVEYRYWLRQ